MRKNLLLLLLAITCQLANAQNKKLTLSILPNALAICRLAPAVKVPAWAFKSSFYSISKTTDELSIVCDQALVPARVKKVENWRAFKIEGPLDFSLTGIVASLAKPLAENKVPVVVISTYDTDYILVESKFFDKAKEVLGQLVVWKP